MLQETTAILLSADNINPAATLQIFRTGGMEASLSQSAMRKPAYDVVVRTMLLQLTSTVYNGPFAQNYISILIVADLH